ncbi:DUF2062 domain-containing protein [Jhaorihella thermophila]|uniref:DUF2062 domain-containing protein n=1 Tax=Jhaorihella thermophila TaxID=488547 RepID=A0A1H5V458_9RHOB|nr:DUF2062 domain-containing protein [Jhaorihella thermophila]SEF81501.1 hypothetical protein SAMN05421751_105112 [Jhaorihella thermophila]
MVFKRRDPRPPLRALAEFIYPRGGWTRAFHYIRHRIRRLPDTPERIARGIWIGVFTSFTPFYGLHFVIAFILARLMRANVIAALMGTLFGNPLTYVPIGVVALQTGHFLLGSEYSEAESRSFLELLSDATADLKNNLLALITGHEADWHGLIQFYDDVFFPYMVGGLIPGVIAATVCYVLTLPVIRAYQISRRNRIKAKFEAIKKKAEVQADAAGAPD